MDMFYDIIKCIIQIQPIYLKFKRKKINEKLQESL